MPDKSIQYLIGELKSVYADAGRDCANGLLPPSSEDAIQEISTKTGLSIPRELRELFSVHGGQSCEELSTNSGFLGMYHLLTPERILETHQMYQDHCLWDPLPKFPPKLNEWGYWVPELIPFASWDANDWCIHSQRLDLWCFCPNMGLIDYRLTIAELLQELIDIVKAGVPSGTSVWLRDLGSSDNFRGMPVV